MAKKASKYKFGDKVHKAIEHEESRKQGFGYLKLPEDVNKFQSNTDQNKIDIIPYIVTDENNLDIEVCGIKVGDPWYRKPFYTHKNVGPNDEIVICPNTIGKKCPICEYVAKKRREGAEYEELKDDYRKLRYLYNVIPIDDEDHEEEFHIWDYSDFLFERKLMDEMKKGNVDEEFASPEDGQTLKIRWIEEHFGKNKFGKAGAVDGIKREPYSEEIIDDAPNLDEVLVIHSYKKLEGMFLDLDDEDFEGEEENQGKEVEEEVEKTSTRRSYRKGKKEKEPEKENEEEKDEKPKGRRGRSTGRKRKEETTSDDKCPHGYRFGVDTEEYEECENCKIYDDCLDEKLAKKND